jgi:predicted  nucleic acid-binding Zn-ribbon protein
MTIWGKTILNIEKGTRKLTVAAATFSEWVKTELAVIRIRIQIDDAQRGIDELHRQIGRKITDLRKQDALPKSTEQLLKDEAVSIALAEIADREQELEGLMTQLKSIRADYKTAVKQTEDTLP